MSIRVRGIALFAAPLVGALLLGAQSTGQYSNQDQSNQKYQSASIMGCLTQGDQSGEYVIKGPDTTYVLTSRGINLGKHVGQEVSVSGSLKPAGTQGTTEMERFKVESISKSADTCQMAPQ